MLDSQQTGRRHVQQPMSKGAKPAGYWVSIDFVLTGCPSFFFVIKELLS